LLLLLRVWASFGQQARPATSKRPAAADAVEFETDPELPGWTIFVRTPEASGRAYRTYHSPEGVQFKSRAAALQAARGARGGGGGARRAPAGAAARQLVESAR